MKLLDLDGRLLYMNLAGAQLLDLCGPQDLVGRPWLALWEGEHQAAAREAVNRAKVGHRGSFEGFCQTAAGVDRKSVV